mgnify:FL=1
MNVLVINCGSSSLKFQLINAETEKVLANASKATANRLIDFFIFYMVFNWLTKFVKNAFIHTKQLQKNNFGAEN